MKFLKLLFPIVLVFFVLFAVPHNVFAACADNANNIVPAPDGLPRVGCGDDRSVIENVLKIAFGALATISLLFVVIGGLKYTLSGGDSNSIVSAKKTILYAIIGLALGISVFTIVSFVFGRLS